jgi:hypothetical protein
MEDRRVFARLEVNFPLRFVDPYSGRECEGKVVDISANGVGMMTDFGLTEETQLEMWLDIPDHHESLRLQGKVVWSRIVSSRECRMGVLLKGQELLSLGRILKYLHNG